MITHPPEEETLQTRDVGRVVGSLIMELKSSASGGGGRSQDQWL